MSTLRNKVPNTGRSDLSTLSSLDFFRKSAGLTPPPRTLSNAASRLVNLLDDYLRVLQIGWENPPGFPTDRFVPSVSIDRDREGPIVQYLVDLGFTGDAHRVHEAMQRCYDIRDWRIMMPSPGDDKGWQQFQQRYVAPLKYEVARLQSVIYEARQLITTTGTKDSVDPAAGGEATPLEVDEFAKLAGTLRQCLNSAKMLVQNSCDLAAIRDEQWPVGPPDFPGGRRDSDPFSARTEA